MNFDPLETQSSCENYTTLSDFKSYVSILFDRRNDRVAQETGSEEELDQKLPGQEVSHSLQHFANGHCKKSGL